tara:strand:+ start:65 stop:340 length:276 start_codon:yes stop_codon:yes gene_type:complete
MTNNKKPWKMKGATNKAEAIISIIDALKKNRLWLNKCTSRNFAHLYNMHITKKRENFLKLLSLNDIIDLYREIKKQHDDHYYSDIINDRLF